jgi:hypothetical protein
MRRAPQAHCLRDRGQERRRQVPPGGRQQLQPLVERQRIRAIGRQQRAGIEQVARDRAGTSIPRPATNLLAVPTDRVDLAVVRDRAERLRQPPDRRGVRGVALVEDRVGHVDRLPEVRIELGEPRAGDQALVDDRPTGRRRDRHVGDRTSGRTGRALQAASRDDQPAFVPRIGDARRSRHDRLRDERA